MIKLKILKTNPRAILPKYAHENDAGMDLFSIDEKIIKPGEISLIDTGIAIELAQNTEAQIRPRSGLALNHGITVLNTPGTIDEGYRGNIGVILINHGKCDFEITMHMRIAQLVIKPTYKVIIEETTELSKSLRNEKGFGSSGLSNAK